jgi:hypothetical protein
MNRPLSSATGCTNPASNTPTPRCNAMTATTTNTKAAATTVAPATASGGSLLQTISALLEQLAQLQNLLGVEPCGALPRPADRRSPSTTGRGYSSSPSRRCRPTPAPAPAARRWQDAPFCADDTDPTDSWDWPWDQMSVVELRALLRCYPIDRTALPAPIELLRRDELLAALHELQPDPQDLFGC